MVVRGRRKVRGGEGFTCVRVHHPSPIISRCLCLQCVSVCAYANAHSCNGLHMFFICFSLLKHTHTVPCVNRSCCCVRHICLNGCVSVCVCVCLFICMFLSASQSVSQSAGGVPVGGRVLRPGWVTLTVYTALFITGILLPNYQLIYGLAQCVVCVRVYVCVPKLAVV